LQRPAHPAANTSAVNVTVHIKRQALASLILLEASAASASAACARLLLTSASSIITHLTEFWNRTQYQCRCHYVIITITASRTDSVHGGKVASAIQLGKETKQDVWLQLFAVAVVLLGSSTISTE
jgi:hypothetical protein